MKTSTAATHGKRMRGETPLSDASGGGNFPKVPFLWAEEGLDGSLCVVSRRLQYVPPATSENPAAAAEHKRQRFWPSSPLPSSSFSRPIASPPLQLSGIPPSFSVLDCGYYFTSPPFLLLLSREPFLPCHLLLSLRPTVACAPPPPPPFLYLCWEEGRLTTSWMEEEEEERKGPPLSPRRLCDSTSFQGPPNSCDKQHRGCRPCN